MKILVVDPDPQVSQALTALLVGAQHDVLAVGTAARALAVALTHDFDLMICDVMLPDMNGEELIRAIKAQTPQLPVLVLSGASPTAWQKICEDAGAATFLCKPLQPHVVLHEVGLVHKARLTLAVALVDTDRIHRTRLAKTLGAIGCSVATFPGASAALAALAAGEHFALWVADASDPEIMALLAALRGTRVPVFTFAGYTPPGLEESLMRAGAALFMAKPIDIDSLLTQASFLAR